MLKCRDINHKASDYQDSSLPLSTRLLFVLHLLICGKCRQFIAHLRSASRVYRGLAETELASAAADQLAAAIIARAAQSRGEEAGTLQDGKQPGEE